MLEKSKLNYLRRLARRAGLRVSTLRTPAGRIFAVIDGRRVVSTCVGFDQVARHVAEAAAA